MVTARLGTISMLRTSTSCAPSCKLLIFPLSLSCRGLHEADGLFLHLALESTVFTTVS